MEHPGRTVKEKVKTIKYHMLNMRYYNTKTLSALI